MLFRRYGKEFIKGMGPCWGKSLPDRRYWGLYSILLSVKQAASGCVWIDEASETVIVIVTGTVCVCVCVCGVYMNACMCMCVSKCVSCARVRVHTCVLMLVYICIVLNSLSHNKKKQNLMIQIFLTNSIPGPQTEQRQACTCYHQHPEMYAVHFQNRRCPILNESWLSLSFTHTHTTE